MIKLSFSWDDGALEDLQLVRLCEKYTIPSMLFIPNENREGRKVLSASEIKNICSELTSVGGHTEHHTYLTELPISEVYDEVFNNKKYLEDLLGEPVTNFSFPGGKYNKDILNTIKNEFKTLRTAETMCSSLNKDVIRPTFHFYPRGKKSLLLNSLRNKDSLFPLCLKNLNKTDDYFDLLQIIIDSASQSKKDFYIHIWGHSWEIEQYNLWSELEKFFSWIHANYNTSVYSYPSPYTKA